MNSGVKINGKQQVKIPQINKLTILQKKSLDKTKKM